MNRIYLILFFVTGLLGNIIWAAMKYELNKRGEKLNYFEDFPPLIRFLKFYKEKKESNKSRFYIFLLIGGWISLISVVVFFILSFYKFY